jgi:D-glycero-alpha-D-manno-heptose-7-phosphate kinase
MIISKTPIRISFLGGGTDYPEYFLRYPGAVLGTTINKYAYIDIKRTHEFFDYNYRISYAKTELKNSIDEIEHPSVRTCLKYMNIREHLEILYQGDWPARTGMGSSSAFTVGLLKALYSFKHKMISKEELAQNAIYIEREIIREHVGWQDQIWASFGGMAQIQFNGTHFEYHPITISAEIKGQFRNHLLLLFTGTKRSAHEILAEQIERTKKSYNDKILSQMRELVTAGTDALYSGNLKEFGHLLHENWKLKKSLSSKVTNPDIDDAYETAQHYGALGGKILGAGGGGFFLIFAKPQCHENIRMALKAMTPVNFNFEECGSSIIHYQDNEIEECDSSPKRSRVYDNYEVLNY